MAELDKEERELVRTVEAEEWQSVPDRKLETLRYQEVAKATFRKDRRVNIRISTRDLEALQARALEEGIPYQTLISSVLHKYVAASRSSGARGQTGSSQATDEVAEAQALYGKTDRAVQSPQSRRESLMRLLEDDIWPQTPAELLGRELSNDEREKLLGPSEDES